MDAMNNLHYEENGVPLSTREIRAAWLKNKGVDVKHDVGIPPHSVT